MSSYATTQATTFNLTHARHLAAKVATDLKRMQRFYGAPSDPDIDSYERELTELLRKGYLATVSYGFRKGGAYIEPTLRYTARELAGASTTDNDPGRVRPGANVVGATFYSYLTYSSAWKRLSPAEKDRFKRTLPYYRTAASEPGVDGYLDSDLEYSAGGRALQRESVRAYR